MFTDPSLFRASAFRPSALMPWAAQSKQKPFVQNKSSLFFSGRTGRESSPQSSDQTTFSTQPPMSSDPPPAPSDQALFHALRQKNYPLLRQRLAARPELANTLDPQDQTPILLEAVALGDLEATALLLNHGADSLRPNPQGITPIVFAVTQGNVPMVQRLLEKGAPLSSYHHNIPLMHLAVRAEQVEMLKALRAEGADVNTTDTAKRTPLHIAAEQDSTEAAQWLLANGAELDAKDGEGYTPLHRAALQGNEAVLTVLQQAGADLNTRNNLGLTPYLTAAGAGKVRLMKALQSAGADVQALTPSGLPALHWASGLNQAEVLRHLLSPKYRPGKPTELNLPAGRMGYTPLHLAVAFQSQDAIEELLRDRKNGSVPADWHLPDANGYTPRDYAETHGSPFLERWGLQGTSVRPERTVGRIVTPAPHADFTSQANPHAPQPGKIEQLEANLAAKQEVPAPSLLPVSLKREANVEVAPQARALKEEASPPLAPKTPSGHKKNKGAGNGVQALGQPAIATADDVTSAATVPPKAGKAKKKGKQSQQPALPQNAPKMDELDEIDEAILAVYGAKPDESQETFLDILNHHSETLKNLDDQGKYDFLSRQLNAFNVNKPYQVSLASSANPLHRLPIQVTPLHVAILSDMPAKWVALFLEKGADPTIKDSVGRSPFHLAASLGRLDYLEALNAKGKWVSQLRKPENWKNTVGNTPLHTAAQSGQTEAVQWFLNKKVPVNVKNDHEETALHLAAKEGHADVIARLLKHNANPETQNSIGRTPLHLAALAGKPEVLDAFKATPKKLFPIKNPQAWKTLEGNTPLHEAAKVGLLEGVQWLLDQGFPINEPNNENETPLHVSAAGGHTAVALKLLEKGANPDARTKVGMNPLHSATHTVATETLDALLRSGKFDPNATLINGSPALHLAVVNHDLASVRLLLANGADINQTESTGRGALQLAAKLNDDAMIDELLKQGADPVQRDIEGENVLHHLLGPGQNHDSKESVTILKRLLGQLSSDTVRQLIYTADQRFHNTPLHMAVAMGNVEAVKLLLANGADPTLTNCAGKNSLMAAVDNSFRASIDEIVKRLLNQPDGQVKRMLAGKTTDEGANVLHLAAALNLTEAMSAILEKQNALARKGVIADLNLNTPDMNGRTPLHYAAILGQVEAVRFLLSENAEPARQDREGRSPLMAAIESSAQAAVGRSREALKLSEAMTDEILAAIRNQAVDAGKSPHQAVARAVNQTNVIGYGPLHMAVTQGRVGLLKKMLQQGADPTLVNKLGGSPLHMAADFENAEVSSQMVEALLEACYRQGGAALVSKMVQLKDSLGATPLYVAKVMNRPALEQRMRHYRPGSSSGEAASTSASGSDDSNVFAKRKVVKVPFLA